MPGKTQLQKGPSALDARTITTAISTGEELVWTFKIKTNSLTALQSEHKVTSPLNKKRRFA
jgi:hypothetical protein